MGAEVSRLGSPPLDGSGPVQCHGGANERLQRLFVNLVAIVETDRPPGAELRSDQMGKWCRRYGASQAGLEPATPNFRPAALSRWATPPFVWSDNLRTSAHLNWGDQPDSHRHKRLHGA
jgi:hypothetical protein